MPMNRGQANRIGPGARLRILAGGLERHGLPPDRTRGTYVSQFDSPAHGRMLVVRVDGDGNLGFRLDELELVDDD